MLIGQQPITREQRYCYPKAKELSMAVGCIYLFFTWGRGRRSKCCCVGKGQIQQVRLVSVGYGWGRFFFPFFPSPL